MEANGGGGGLEVEDGGDHALANGGGGHALANGALANGGGQGAAMEAGGAVGNGGLQVMVAPNGAVPAQAVAAPNTDALYLVFLRLPAQEIARCRMVCRLWRDITGTEAFRRDHHRHPYRTPMPLFFFQGPGPFDVRAVDIRDRVSRPVIRYPSDHHDMFRIHGSFAGILLLSSGDRLYACNPCTRRWERLPPLHVDNNIIGFYAPDTDDEHGNFFMCHVLYHDRQKPDCEYGIFELDGGSWSIGRPNLDEDVNLNLALANGIAPSYRIPPVYVDAFLFWPPQAAWANSDILMFDTAAESFLLISPPTIQVGSVDCPIGVGGQLLEIGEDLAMAVFSPETVDVWVLSNINNLWSHDYRIHLHQNDAHIDDVAAVDPERCPFILHAHHGSFFPRHTIEESLILHPALLTLLDTDAVDGDPPFFQNQ